MLVNQQKRVLRKLRHEITRLSLGVNTKIDPDGNEIIVTSDLLTTPILRDIVTICDKEGLNYYIASDSNNKYGVRVRVYSV